MESGEYSKADKRRRLKIDKLFYVVAKELEVWEGDEGRNSWKLLLGRGCDLAIILTKKGKAKEELAAVGKRVLDNLHADYVILE